MSSNSLELVILNGSSIQEHHEMARRGCYPPSISVTVKKKREIDSAYFSLLNFRHMVLSANLTKINSSQFNQTDTATSTTDEWHLIQIYTGKLSLILLLNTRDSLQKKV